MERAIFLTVYRQGQEPFTKEITEQRFYSLYDIVRSAELMFDEYADIEIIIPGKVRENQQQAGDSGTETGDESGHHEEETRQETGCQDPGAKE